MQYPFSCMPHVQASIEAALSPSRLTPFVREAGGDRYLAIRLYVWNARLCEEFYIPIQLTEVAARNAISQALSDTYGPNWFDEARFTGILPERHRRELSVIVQKKKNDMGTRFSVNDVIAGMTFGFWVHLMRDYYSFMMKRRGIRAYFPNFPAGMKRQDIYTKMDSMRAFRNDIFHHEPVFLRGPKRQYTNIRDLLSWLCRDTLWLMGQISNPDAVIQRRPTV